jgi:ribosomal protein L40E
MAKKNVTYESAIKPVVCTKCGAKTITNPGSKHRRCPGTQNAKPIPKGKLIESANRGIWQ